MIVSTYEETFGKPLTVRELYENFKEDTATGAVTSMNGKLNIRPPYQREFVYDDDNQKAVIHSVISGFPLNVIYFAKDNIADTLEVMDGQQRILSICKYLDGQYSVSVDIGGSEQALSYVNLPTNMQADIMNYKLSVYVCDGTEQDKLEWFKIINIAGVKLTKQERRNAFYTGSWLTDAKRYFSRADGEGFSSEGNSNTYTGHIYGDYVDVVGGQTSLKENAVVRQKLLETVLSWAVDAYNREHKEEKDIDIEAYMDMHRFDDNAEALKTYYENVLEWTRRTFPTYYEIMKKVNWGVLYNQYKDIIPADDDPSFDEQVEDIMSDRAEITNPKNVFEAVLSGNMNLLNARAFDKRDMQRRYNEQKGMCPYCNKKFEITDMQGDHIVPWSKGGKTEYDNLQMLCIPCNQAKKAHDVGYRPWDDKKYQYDPQND